ncbi:MAG TPA: DUF2249 domain-containing protein [Kofleriaceae bacterium]|nr:DUF2249 domain-containing protein [Kofleriaceae bacterium]
MLALSTEVAPRRSLEDLDRGCRARGLDGLEVVIAADGDADSVFVRARSSGARVVALQTARIDAASAPAIARAAADLGVPVSVSPAAVDPDSLAHIAGAFARAGARLLLGCHTNLDEALELVLAVRAIGTPAALGLAWELHPSSAADLSEASALLLATRELLGVVRLHGGGPEQRDQDGYGIGPLFVELALSGFAGPIVLCPSSPEMVTRWTQWLGSRGSSGCGHAVSTREVELDVRGVEPRHRLETIMGAYRMLVPGATLHLTVDHDPVCMYYTLEATEPERSFSFQVVEHGPEIWRAEVTKR